MAVVMVCGNVWASGEATRGDQRRSEAISGVDRGADRGADRGHQRPSHLEAQMRDAIRGH